MPKERRDRNGSPRSARVMQRGEAAPIALIEPAGHVEVRRGARASSEKGKEVRLADSGVELPDAQAAWCAEWQGDTDVRAQQPHGGIIASE